MHAGWQGSNMIVRISQTQVVLFERAVRQFWHVDGGAEHAVAPGTLAFVAVDGDEIQGWCWGYHLIRPDNSSMLYLDQLEVGEKHRRKGIGRALVHAFMAAGKAVGATRMCLTTGEANVAARALYEALGGGLASQGPTVNYWFVLTS